MTVKKTKSQRAEEAAFRKKLKRARQTNALSLNLLHALSLRDALMERITMFGTEQEKFSRTYMDAIHELRPNLASQVAALMTVFYGSLYTVTEGWLNPKQASPRLTDSRVDPLLAPLHLKRLADFRNATFHANSLTDSRIARFNENHHELLPWSLKLTTAFRDYFLQWRANLSIRIYDVM